MKKENEKVKNSTTGLTIISLAVTIIVLMILAGVTINVLSGENGVLNQAKSISSDEQQKQESEQVTINALEAKLASSEDEVTISKAELTALVNSIVNQKIEQNNQEIESKIDQAKSEAKLEAYPVGSIYISTSNTNPSTFIGGTWVAYGQGRTLIGAGTGTDSNSTSKTFSAGSTGGEYTHTLTIAEMPSHAHTRGTMEILGRFYVRQTVKYNDILYTYSGTNAFSYSASSDLGWDGDIALGGSIDTPGVMDFTASNSWTGETSYVGSGNSHNNIQPYIVTYMWKRTA
jgi:hypothetical protein